MAEEAATPIALDREPVALAVSAPASAKLRLLDRAIWRDAALMWLLQHVLLFGVLYVGASCLLPGATTVVGSASATAQGQRRVSERDRPLLPATAEPPRPGRLRGPHARDTGS